MLPISTTTIAVLRPNPADEPYETPGAPSTVASGIRAHISTSRGDETTTGGDQEVVYFRLDCDPFAGTIDHGDQIVDLGTDEVYEVLWSRLRRGLGLDHHEAGLKQVAGVRSAPVAGF